MSAYIVLFDANVLYPAPMRDLLLQLAVTDIFRARWTADIHREWTDALLLNQPCRDRAALGRTRDKMDTATRDCLVTCYHSLIPSLQLPDPDDRHILAAAIVGRCDAIVTQNLQDFPDEPHRDFRRQFYLSATRPLGLLQAARSKRLLLRRAACCRSVQGDVGC